MTPLRVRGASLAEGRARSPPARSRTDTPNSPGRSPPPVVGPGFENRSPTRALAACPLPPAGDGCAWPDA